MNQDLVAQVNAAYANLTRATTEHTQTVLAKMRARDAFDHEFQTGIYGGRYVGKNEAERLGNMRHVVPEIVDAAMEMDLIEYEVRSQVILAKLEVKRLELLITGVSTIEFDG